MPAAARWRQHMGGRDATTLCRRRQCQQHAAPLSAHPHPAGDALLRRRCPPAGAAPPHPAAAGTAPAAPAASGATDDVNAHPSTQHMQHKQMSHSASKHPGCSRPGGFPLRVQSSSHCTDCNSGSRAPQPTCTAFAVQASCLASASCSRSRSASLTVGGDLAACCRKCCVWHCSQGGVHGHERSCSAMQPIGGTWGFIHAVRPLPRASDCCCAALPIDRAVNPARCMVSPAPPAGRSQDCTGSATMHSYALRHPFLFQTSC